MPLPQFSGLANSRSPNLPIARKQEIRQSDLVIPNSSHPAGDKIKHAKPSPPSGNASAIFKQSFNIGALNEGERAMARAMLQRLTAPTPDRTRP